ncbi:hypothetical protein [Salinispora arenicola]|uniref:hypothetical protein n=1 Tax=Salinispora arenicola TaxID=168697 RepID=UPI000370AF2A|nr:hypothetical protein [Salinispora arenicola]
MTSAAVLGSERDGAAEPLAGVPGPGAGDGTVGLDADYGTAGLGADYETAGLGADSTRPTRHTDGFFIAN